MGRGGGYIVVLLIFLILPDWAIFFLYIDLGGGCPPHDFALSVQIGEFDTCHLGPVH